MGRNSRLIRTLLVLWTAFFAEVCTALAGEFEELVSDQQKVQQMTAAGQYREATPLATQVVARAERFFEDRPVYKVTFLIDLGQLYARQGRYAEAEPLFKRALAIVEKALDKDNPGVADALHNLGILYFEQGRYPEAEPLFKRALAIRENTLGKSDPAVAGSLFSLALVHSRQRSYTEAEPLFQRSIAIVETANGKDHPDVADKLHSLAYVVAELGRYPEAEALHKRALAISEKAHGKDSMEVARGLHFLGMSYRLQGRYADAESHLERALAIREKILGQDHPGVAQNLGELAAVHLKRGRYAQAESLYQRALAIDEKVFGKDSVQVAWTLNNLAFSLDAESRFAETEPLYIRSLTILEKVYGKDDPGVAESLNNLADIYVQQGRYADAESLHKRALAIREKTLGKEHLEVAKGIAGLGALYVSQDRCDEAVACLERALAILEKVLGKEHPLVAENLVTLAIAYRGQERPAEAEQLYLRALAVKEKALGKQHSDVATVLNNLAGLYSDQGRQADAEQMYRRALTIMEDTFGKENPMVAVPLMNLANVKEKEGHFADAEAFSERALTILNRARLNDQRGFKIYHQRARLHWRAQRKDEALLSLNKALDLADRARGQASGGEHHRAMFYAGFSGAYELMVDYRTQLRQPAEALAAIERFRARSLMDQLSTANIDLLAGLNEAEATPLRRRESESNRHLAELQKQAELATSNDAIERELAQARQQVVDAYEAIRNASPAYRQMVGKSYRPAPLADIQSRLAGPDGLVLEYFLGDEGGYVVVISPTGSAARIEKLALDQPQAAQLGVDAGPLTNTRMRQILANKAGAGVLQQLRSVSKNAAAIDRLATLWTVLVPAAERELLTSGKLKHWTIIPDASLAAFPFETLVVELGDEPRYALDVAPPLTSAPSATLLLNLLDQSQAPRGSAQQQSVLSVGDVVYGGQSQSEQSRGAIARGPLTARTRYAGVRGDLKPLPFTGWEAQWVAKAFKALGLQAGSLVKENAREASVRRYASGYRILHLACHGLVDDSNGNLFGALALTPGPTGSADPSDDGFLTLAEIYALNLHGAELSILSACDTNYGPEQQGEGVWSLSRGFLVAGSKRVVASNWLVDDEAGASLISIFCSGIAQGEKAGAIDYAQALQVAKRRIREQDKWKSPFYWGTFVLIGPN